MSNIDWSQDSAILKVFKPVGMTSFQAVSKVKRELSFPRKRKIGHFGTLDPFASGLLLIGVNKATKLMDFAHKLLPKSYIAIGKFGESTDTGDLTGQAVRSGELEAKWIEATESHLTDKLQDHFQGEYWQAPHQFSAAKFEGRPLYEYAREGIFIERPKTKREVYDIKVLNYKYPYFMFKVEVSTGTYIRVLFEEVAQLLGGEGHLVGLIRDSIGGCQLSDMTPLWSKSEAIWPSELFPELPGLNLSCDDYNRLANGVRVNTSNSDAPLIWASCQEKVGQIGLVEIKDNLIRPEINGLTDKSVKRWEN